MHFDSHVHSAASPDSELDPVRAILALKKKGLGIAFTEHVDFVTPTEGKDITATDAPENPHGDFVCDFDIYPSQYKPIQREYGRDNVLLGLEIGLNAAYYPVNSQLAAQDYDFILGSIHYVDGCDIYYSGASMEPYDFCRQYLIYSKKMVEYCGFFDALGHIDYIMRYCDHAARVFKYENFPTEFDALFKALAERDLAMEINTSRFGDNKLIGQLLPMYKRFKALGGRYVTIGSDSHNKHALGRFYKKGLGLANMAGLVPVYFRERVRTICE